MRSLPFWLERHSRLFLRISREARRNRSYKLEVIAAGFVWLVTQQLGFHARANIEAVLLDVRRHRRKLIGKRMVAALEHQSWELKH